MSPGVAHADRNALPGQRQAFLEKLMAAAFTLPAIILMFLTILAPLGVLGFLSLTDYEFGAVTVNFVGLENFTAALDDPELRNAFLNTFKYVAIVLPGSVILALLAAVLVHRRKRTRSFYEVVYFLPVTSTFIAMATVWQFVLHPSLGPINAALQALGFAPMPFLTEPSLALPTLAVIGIWQLLGFNMILFLAGLSTIPRDLYEAAAIDGCYSETDKFFTVTLPMLGPTMIFVIVTSSITAFKIFDSVAVLTRGGPMGTTDVLLYKIYREGFQYYHMAYGAVLTFIFLVTIVIFSAIQSFVSEKRVHY